MNNKPKKHTSKHNFKFKKRMVKVLKALFLVEQHTASIASTLQPLVQNMHRTQAVIDGPLTRPVSNKKKMDEFRENWLDKQEVIRLMPVTERSLYALRKEGKLPSYTFKGKIFFKLKDVENLMQSK
jgi:hypothetical protein